MEGRASSRLAAVGLGSGYAGRPISRDLSFALPDRAFTAVIGPNGCGKSTLLRTLARIAPAQEGAVTLDGATIASYPTREVARRLGLLPQAPVAPEGLTVFDLAARGRFPHRRLFGRWSEADARATAAALAAAGLSELADRPLDELSGGQRQRAWLAMALAQETPLLLMDEPTTFLDIAHQIEMLELFRELVAAGGRTVVAVLHDLNHACRYADHLVVMRAGAILAAGPPREIVTEGLIARTFGLDCVVIPDPTCGAPLVLPVPRPPARAG